MLEKILDGTVGFLCLAGSFFSFYGNDSQTGVLFLILFQLLQKDN